MKPIIKYFCISSPKALKATNIFVTIFIGSLGLLAYEEDYPIQIFMGKNKPFEYTFDARKNCSSDEGPAIISYDILGNVVTEHYILNGEYIGVNLNFSKEDFQNYLLLR